MKKNNNRGFVLAETLVVTVFIMTIFTIIYVNFFPLIGEYEKREFYDDIDSKYYVYWFKRMLQSPQLTPTDKFNALNTSIVNNGYVELTTVSGGKTVVNSSLVTTNADAINMWNQYISDTHLTHLYITGYHLGVTNIPGNIDILGTNADKHFKKKVTSIANENLIDYVTYLPDYKYDSLNDAKYRLIAEFERKYSDATIVYKAYSTIEVKR